MKKVCVVGLGYIGLPTAIVVAQAGLDVIGIDINESLVDCINRCCPVIKEPELVTYLREAIKEKNFYATTVYESSDYFIIAVPTPCTDDKTADLSYVFAAVSSIAGVLKKGDTVILESTVPVGTTKKLAESIHKKTNLEPGVDFFIAHCPERVLPGNIFHELKVNDRIIGGINYESTKHVAAFYNYFVSGDLYLTTAETAELAKLVENSYRDVNIAFAHQVAAMAKKVHVDVYELIELANKHPRVNILKPTVGVGGHCLAVDPWFLVETFKDDARLLKEARLINDARPYDVLDHIYHKIEDWKKKYAKETCIIGILGITYKQNVDDIRESPALCIAEDIVKNYGNNVFVCEPHVDDSVVPVLLKKHMINFDDILIKSDVICILVAHDIFKNIPATILMHKHVLDMCGIFSITQNQLEEKRFFWPLKDSLKEEQDVLFDTEWNKKMSKYHYTGMQ